MPVPLRLPHPIGIAMWDFSWLERRWPGAGYEDWDIAVGELADRGYDAVRIDAYPHLISARLDGAWTLLPEWTTNDWGAPGRCAVAPWPALSEFLGVCRRQGVRVALSSWFRQDTTERRLELTSPELLGRAWLHTLRRVADAGHLDILLYVDLCNEWPLEPWARFYPGPREWNGAESHDWMRRSIEVVRSEFPTLPLCFSNTTDASSSHVGWSSGEADLLEPHVWMATASDYYARLGYHYERFDLSGYGRVAANARALFESDSFGWINALDRSIDASADWGRRQRRPLVTTECWALVDYKDWPMLEWDWIKEICAHGLSRAAATGAWAALATSNFCGPQFRGMWRDTAWHRRLNQLVRRGRLPVY
jgi:hypothetical protein